MRILLYRTKILLGCHAVFLLECAEKMIVSAKSSQPVHLGNGTPLFDIMTAQVQFGFDDIAMQGLSCLAFEFPCNMEPADIEYLLQLLQSDFFRDMGTDVHEQLVHHQMFTAALRAVLLRVDTGAQHEDDEHLQQALLKQCAGKAVVLLRQRDHAACQAFDEHGYLTVCPHSDAPEGHHVEEPFMFPPLATGYEEWDGSIEEQNRAFYLRLAQSGVGLPHAG